MKITIERELDVERLFDDMIDDFTGYTACEDAGLHCDDITADVLADIFSELADIAAKRAAKAARARRE